MGLPFAEDVVGETKEETGFTDGGVSDEEELEKEILSLDSGSFLAEIQSQEDAWQKLRQVCVS